MPHTLSLQNDLFKWFLDCSGRKALPRAPSRRGQKFLSPKGANIHGIGTPPFRSLAQHLHHGKRNRKEDSDDI